MSEIQFQIDGKQCSEDTAIETAKSLIENSSAPLVCGFSDWATEVQREIVKFARSINATADWTSSQAQIDSILSLQQVGRVTCSQGEIKNRADLVIAWEFDFAKNEMAQATFAGKDLITVSTAEMKQDSKAFVVENRLEFIGQCLQRIQPDAFKFCERIENAQYAVIAFHSQKPEMSVAEFQELNRFVSSFENSSQVRMFDFSGMDVNSSVTNSHGAENVMTWISGFPCAVRFLSNGRCEYDPQRLNTSQIFLDQSSDLNIVFGEVGELNSGSCQVPCIEFGRVPNPRAKLNVVVGEDASGTRFRNDGIPIRSNELSSSANQLISFLKRLGRDPIA